MPRRPRTMSLSRVRGTLIALLRALMLSSSGSRNSSLRISPGCTGAISRLRRRTFVIFSTVVVDDFNFIGISVPPRKANPPLVIDSDRISTGAVAFELFQPISRNPSQFVETSRRMKCQELRKSPALRIARYPPAGATGEEIGRFPRGEVLYHCRGM